MKKIALIFILITTISNSIYASFPIKINTITVNDTLKKESIEEYHLRMEKMGFDIESCKCVNCQNKKKQRSIERSIQNDILYNSEDYKKEQDIKKVKNLYTTAGMLMLGAIFSFMLSLMDGIKCIEDRDTCDNSGMPYLYLAMILFYGSFVPFIKGLIMSSKNRKKYRNN